MKRAGPAIALVLVFLLGIAFGRYATPARVEERLVEVEAQRSSTVDQAHQVDVDTTAIATTHVLETTTRPDGTVTVTETVKEEAVREVVREVEVVKTVVEERLVYVDKWRETTSPARPSWRVGVDAGLAYAAPRRVPISGIPGIVPVVAGGSVERRIAGPVWGGVWASSSPAAGVRLSVEF